MLHANVYLYKISPKSIISNKAITFFFSELSQKGREKRDESKINSQISSNV